MGATTARYYTESSRLSRALCWLFGHRLHAPYYFESYHCTRCKQKWSSV